ncbi:MAG TPA: Nif3-like dinuclear metal center hexameric protein [Chroococcales cyanobacterium]
MYKQEIFDFLQALAPDRFAAPWDNGGLQVGRLDEALTGIMVSLNPSSKAIEEAKKNNCNLLVCHHPLFFKLPNKLDTAREPGKTISAALRSDVTIVSFHTSLDSVALNRILAERLDLPLDNLLLQTGKNLFFKLVVFVPSDSTQKVAEALWAAGAGKIGSYEEASFISSGIGTFKPIEGAHPFIGEIEKREEVKEDRLEVIVPQDCSKEVLAALRASHPYEAIAYDLIELEGGEPYGFGLWGKVEKTTVREIAKKIQKILKPGSLRLAGNFEDRVEKIGLCGGGGSDLLASALEKKLDLFITGECKYHTALDARAAGLNVLEVGHQATEQPVVDFLIQTLKEKTDRPVLGNWEEEPFQSFTEGSL